MNPKTLQYLMGHADIGTTLMSYDEIVRTATDNYLANMTPDNHPDLNTIQAELMIETRRLVNSFNIQSPKGQAYQLPKELSAWQIATVLMKTDYIANVDMVGDRSAAEFCLLASYQREGEDKGTYSYDEVVFKRPIRRLKPSITQRKTVFWYNESHRDGLPSPSSSSGKGGKYAC